MHINKVTIWDANISLNIEQFVKEFAELQTVSLVNMQSEYNQIELNKESCDLTDFMTVLSLLRNCTLIQDRTNSVAQFCQTMIQILEDLISDICHMFLDDIVMKEPQSDYNGKESLSEVCWYILEAIQNLNCVLINVECVSECVSEEKSQYIMKQLQIITYICELKECLPEAVKTLKLVDWPSCSSVEDAHAFIGLCVYYQLWIKNFALIAALIYDLFKKISIYCWGDNQQKTMNRLKIVLSTQPVIWSLNYDENTEDIVLAVNSSLTEWGFCLMQMMNDKKQWHICWYDSETWSVTESAYDAEKWECHNLLKFLKKVQAYLYEVSFIIELNVQTLIAQLNCSAADVSDVLINCWLAWIYLFDFDVQHVSEKKHQAADALSQWPLTDNDNQSNKDVKEFLNSQLFHFSVHAYLISTGHAAVNKFSLITFFILNFDLNYLKKQKQIAQYLITLKCSAHINDKKFMKFKMKTLQYLVQKTELFQCVSKNMSIKRVVNNVDEQQEIIESLHNQTGYKEIEFTY